MSSGTKVKGGLAIVSILFAFLEGLSFAFANGTICPPTINYGQTVSCSIDASGELDLFIFSVNAGDIVTALIARTSGNLWPGISLRSPGGSELCENSGPVSSEITACELPGSGTHTLLVNDSFNGTFTGSYNLTLERLNPGTGPFISFGQSVSGTLLAGDLNSHLFLANAGDSVTVRMTTTSGNLWPGISLYTPAGVELCSGEGFLSAEIGSCTIPGGGTYTLLAYDSFDRTFTGNYSLFLGLHPETISAPHAPDGAKEGSARNSYSYSTGGSSSSFDHPVEYLFDWGDGTNSDWLPVGGTVASHSWTTPSTYTVKAQARCSRDHSVGSAWSEALEVVINEPRPIDVWHQRYSLPADSSLITVTYGNNIFVAMGVDGEFQGEILTSTDGTSWTLWESWPFKDTIFYDITYAENIFVAVGSEGVVITSPDGINWTERTSPAWGLSGVTHGNNIFVAVGTLSTIITSPDGKRWTKRDSGVPIPPGEFVTFEKVAYGNDTFVVVGNISDLYGGGEGILLTSPNGTNWTRTGPGYRAFSGITYGNGIFVAVGEDIIITSPDGIHWTEQNFDPTVYISGVGYGNGTFVAVGAYGSILISIDGITWEKINSETTVCLMDIAYGNHTFVAVGGVILQSDPLLAETETVSPPNPPAGAGNCNLETSCTYSTGGSSSNLGHLVRYLFDWGDGTDSGWLSIGTTSATKVWTSVGTYFVKAQARCVDHTSIVSSWSSTLPVTVSSPPSLQSPSNGAIFNSCSLITKNQPSFTWTATETFTSCSILLSTSGGVLINKASVRGPTNSWTPSSFVWKKVMTSSSQNGEIYWKVIGTRSNRTTSESDAWSFTIGSSQLVTINGPPAGPLPGGTPPTFDFNTNCNLKFKLEISSAGDFSDPKKIKSFNYSTRDPNVDQRLIKKLSSFQWNSIKKLIGTEMGLFRIKAWDGINRETVSDPRSFTILPSLVGTWDTSGSETLTATYKDGTIRKGTFTYHDEFTFNLDGTFHMRDLSGTWTQQGGVFTINVPFEEVKRFFEQHYLYQGYTVNVTSASTSFTGKENITNDTISGRFVQEVDLSHPYNDVPIKANIDYPFTGQRQQGAQVLTLQKNSLKGTTSLFDIISKQLSQSGLVE